MNNYALPLFLIALVSCAISAYAFARRRMPGAWTLALLMLALTVYAFAYGVELTCSALSQMLFWNHLQYLAIPALSVLFLIFALQFSGRGAWITPPRLGLLFIVPAITALANFTNSWHHLYYRSVRGDLRGPFPMLALEPGILYWLHLIYAFSIFIVAACLLLYNWRGTPPQQRWRIVLLLGSALAPAVAALIYLCGWLPLPNLDLTPFGFAITGVVLLLGLSRYNLLELKPIARNIVLDAMHDGVIVADNQGRLVDINAAACELLWISSAQAIGRPAQALATWWPALSQALATEEDLHCEVVLPRTPPRWFDLQVTQIHSSSGISLGWLLLIRETTSRRQAEQARQDRELRERELDSIRTTAGTLAHEVNNPLTGVIANLEMLLDDEPDAAEQRQMLREVLVAAQRIREVVAELQRMQEASYKPYLADRQILDLGGPDSGVR